MFFVSITFNFHVVMEANAALGYVLQGIFLVIIARRQM